MTFHQNNDTKNSINDVNLKQTLKTSIKRPLGVYLSSYYKNNNFDDFGKTDPSRNLYDGYFLMNDVDKIKY